MRALPDLRQRLKLALALERLLCSMLYGRARLQAEIALKTRARR